MTAYCDTCGRALAPCPAGGDATAFTNEPRYIGYFQCVCSHHAWDNSRERWNGEGHAAYMRRIEREHPRPSMAVY